MAEMLNVVSRETRGSRAARRMRHEGKIPAILYGRGEPSISLTVAAEDLHAALRHGAHVVDLQGAVQDKALLREVQWDTFGAEVLHVDLTRVVAGEKVELTLAIELRGEAPGLKSGGILRHVTHEVELRCPVGNIPESLEVNINELDLGQAVTAGELRLPEGAELNVADDLVIVQCVEAMVEEEVAEEEEGAAAEPEVIGRKEEEGSAGE